MLEGKHSATIERNKDPKKIVLTFPLMSVSFLIFCLIISIALFYFPIILFSSERSFSSIPFLFILALLVRNTISRLSRIELYVAAGVFFFDRYIGSVRIFRTELPVEKIVSVHIANVMSINERFSYLSSDPIMRIHNWFSDTQFWNSHVKPIRMETEDGPSLILCYPEVEDREWILKELNNQIFPNDNGQVQEENNSE